MRPSNITLMKKIGFSLYLTNLFFRLFFGLNRKAPFSLNFTSRVRVPSGIKIAESEDYSLYRCLAESYGVYIQALNGVSLHSCLNMGPGVKIISANHKLGSLREHECGAGISIGKGVWLGAGVIVLPGVVIGDGCAVGAGSVVVKSLPSHTLCVGNPCKVVKQLEG